MTPETVMFDGELREALGLKRSAYCARKKTGEFKWLELNPQLKAPSKTPRYSRVKVTLWLSGALVPPTATRAVPRFMNSHLVPRKPRVSRPHKRPSAGEDAR